MDAKEYLERGNNYFKKGGNDSAAIADFTEAIRLDPNLTDAYYYRGLAYSLTTIKEYDKAIADLEMAVKLNPAEKDYRKDLKKVRARAGYGYSIIGAIIGGIVIGSIGGGLFSNSKNAVIAIIICILIGILIGGVHRVRRVTFSIIVGIIKFFRKG